MNRIGKNAVALCKLRQGTRSRSRVADAHDGRSLRKGNAQGWSPVVCRRTNPLRCVQRRSLSYDVSRDRRFSLSDAAAQDQDILNDAGSSQTVIEVASQKAHDSMENLKSQKISVKPITKTDISKVVAFLCSDFLVDEPLNKAVDLTKDEAADLFRIMVTKASEDGYSYFALDDSTGSICAARLNAVVKAKENYPTPDDIEAFDLPHSSKYIFEIVERCEQHLFTCIPSNSRVFKFDVVSVAKDYQNRHIAKALVDHTLARVLAPDPETGKSRFTHLVTIATSYKTQNLYEKLGFQEVLSYTLKDYVAFDGSTPFANVCQQTNPCAKMYLKKI